MSEVTRLLHAIGAGETAAAEQLLTLVYDELRRLAAAQMAREKPGQTLDATALVHEAWLRLMPPGANEPGDSPGFANRRQFFAAAAESMRRILVDCARARLAVKRGGNAHRLPLELEQVRSRYADDELIDTHSLLDNLAQADAMAAEVTRLHVFGGFSLAEIAGLLSVSRATAYRNWTYARAWLRAALSSKNSAIP